MCCATKSFLVNVIVWFITMLGLAPLTQDWVGNIEEWLGYSPINRTPVVIQYYSEDDFALHATIQTPLHWDDGADFPAVLTFYRPNSESQPALGLSEHLAELGYVSISFEYPASPPDGADSLDHLAQAAMHWTVENSASLGINPLKIALWASGNHANVSTRLALHALTTAESADATALAHPSVLFLISSRQLLEFEQLAEGEEPTTTALSISDIEPGLPSTVLLVSDDAASEQLVSAEQFLEKTSEAGNDCEIVVYERGVIAKASETTLEAEIKALAAAMHEVLGSIGFWDEEG